MMLEFTSSTGVSYYLPIKATKMTSEVKDGVGKSYEDRCVKCETPKREMLLFCPKCDATTETVRVNLKEETGSRDMWDFEEVSGRVAIGNIPRIDGWYVIEKAEKAKMTAKEKMAMAKSNTSLIDLLTELASRQAVLKCFYLGREGGLTREAFILPSGKMMTTSPRTVIKPQFAQGEGVGVVEEIQALVAEQKEKVVAVISSKEEAVPPISSLSRGG